MNYKSIYVLFFLFFVSSCSKTPGSEATVCNDSYCPTMVIIPSGAFTMGNLDQQVGNSAAKPSHRVTIKKSFAMGKYDITFDEYDAYAKANGLPLPSDLGQNGIHTGRGKKPAINIGWDQAVSYTKWLSEKTGKSFRLPSSAEWEYAARAGTTSIFYWGDDVGINNANCIGCNSAHDSTTDVGLYPPNKFGLYDMLGNVRQWTLDCGFYGYEGAPDDGSAWISGIPRNMDCKAHVLRGSDIFLQPHTFFLYKTATPIWAFDIGNIYTKNVGFRIVQDL